VGISAAGAPIPFAVCSVHSPVIASFSPPSSHELVEFSAAAARLWQLDGGRLTAGQQFQINVGGLIPQGSSHSGKDFASASLFSFVAADVWSAPTFANFLSLLDNYEPRCGVPETVTDVERAEEAKFLDSCLQTPPMQYAHAWLLAKGLASSSIAEFRQQLWILWFKLYALAQTPNAVCFLC
jgi:poly(U)-specific endoribonuclease